MKKRTMYVLMELSDEFRPVYEALREVAREAGFYPHRADEDPRRNIVKAIIDSIHRATIVVADLTYYNPNVMYELGVANALSKDCLMICQRTPSGIWRVSRTEADVGDLAFDIKGIKVEPYVNDAEGLKMLKDRLRKALEQNEPFDCPVNTALDDFVKRNRLFYYTFWGSIISFLIGSGVSIVSALMGSSMVWKYAPDDTVFRHLLAGGIAAFVMGGPLLFAYARAVNLHGADLKRRHVLAAEAIAGIFNGFIVASILFFLDVRRLGFEITFSFAIACWIIPVVAGLAMGLSLNIQLPRAEPETLSSHMAKAALWWTLAVIVSSSLIYGARASLFYPSYLERFELIDVLAESVRVSLWGLGVALLQWWLKWERRI